MRNVAFAGTIELCTVWVRARESSISLLDWRRQCHSGPPWSRIGPKDIDSTPVLPRYYSPGLPGFLTMPILTGVARQEWPHTPLTKECHKHTHTGHALPD